MRLYLHLSRCVTKSTIWALRPEKTQISIGIGVFTVLTKNDKTPRYLLAKTDQTGSMDVILFFQSIKALEVP